MDATKIIEEAKAGVNQRVAEGWTKREIADEAGVSYDWLMRLMRDAIPNPGIYTVEAVHYVVTS